MCGLCRCEESARQHVAGAQDHGHAVHAQGPLAAPHHLQRLPRPPLRWCALSHSSHPTLPLTSLAATWSLLSCGNPLATQFQAIGGVGFRCRLYHVHCPSSGNEPKEFPSSILGLALGSLRIVQRLGPSMLSKYHDGRAEGWLASIILAVSCVTVGV